MSIQPEQTAQRCQTCASDPHAAPGRYCLAGGTCYCQHTDCPAYPTSPPKRDPWGNVTPITKET